MNNDLISREDLKKAIDDAYEEYDGYDPHDLSRFAERVDDLIDNTPTVPQTQITVFTENGNKEELEQELQRVLDEIRPQGEWEAVGFVNMKYAWCRCSKCHKTTKIYLDSSNEFCCISDIRKKAVACLYCGADMRQEAENEQTTD